MVPLTFAESDDDLNEDGPSLIHGHVSKHYLRVRDSPENKNAKQSRPIRCTRARTHVINESASSAKFNS